MRCKALIVAGTATLVLCGTPSAAPAWEAASGQGLVAGGVQGEAEAYYQFLLGRHFESEGEIERAIEAHRLAARLDPAATEILAELAALYARQDRGREATEAAERALKLDPRNAEANRVLGFVYASLAHPEDSARPPDANAAAYAARAIKHLEAARRSDRFPEIGAELALGRVYLQTGAHEKAISVLARIVELEPDRPEIMALLAGAYEAAGRPDEAIALLESGVVLHPHFLGALGELYERQQRWTSAAETYEKAVARQPRSLELKTRLATALLSAGNPDGVGRAAVLLEEVRRDSPADSRVLYLLAQAQRLSGRLDEAEATARALMAQAPSVTSGPYILAQVLEAKQQYRQIVDTLEPIVAKAPGDPAENLTALRLHLGFAYQELGEHDKAIAIFRDTRAAAPSNVPVDLYLLQSLVAGREYSAALDLARTLRQSLPGDQRVIRLEAEALRANGQAQAGLGLLQEDVTRHPDDPMAYVALAEAYVSNQQHDAALGVLGDGARRLPSDLAIVFQMGAVYERQKKFAEAEQAFRQVIARDPKHAPALNYLGYMLADRGERLEEAIGYITRALAVEPHNAAYVDSLGWAYFKANRLELAEEHLRRAAEQRSRDSAVLDHLGDLLFRRGRYLEAAAAWERALAGDGEQVDLRGIERKIRTARERGQAK